MARTRGSDKAPKLTLPIKQVSKQHGVTKQGEKPVEQPKAVKDIPKKKKQVEKPVEQPKAVKDIPKKKKPVEQHLKPKAAKAIPKETS
jgi:hypothetical protein